MALSLKNTLASLTLSGALLLTGFLAGDEPRVYTANPAFSNTATHTSTATRVHHTDSKSVPEKSKRAFAAPYFSFGKPGFAQGAKQ